LKRSEVLERLGYTVPEIKKKRVIVVSDIKAEADDQFAITHHLLTPCFEVKGIIATHFEWQYRTFEHLKSQRGMSMKRSYDEGMKILELMGIHDVPLLKGSKYELASEDDIPDSEGADLIVSEAMKEDDRPLYIALQGNLTDLAIAYKKQPLIADRLTAIFIGGGSYPSGGDEMNIKGDLIASRIVFGSPIKMWQIPFSTYTTMEISLAELVDKVKPYGDIGAYLCKQMLELNDFYGKAPLGIPFPHGESWGLGDNPTISVLLQNEGRVCWHIEKAPYINDDLTYSNNPLGKEIRVYDTVDTRMTLEDFFSKLKICYG
jgi:purine nucleosidase